MVFEVVIVEVEEEVAVMVVLDMQYLLVVCSINYRGSQVIMFVVVEAVTLKLT